MNLANSNTRQILYSRVQAASALSLSVRSIDRLIKDGHLPHRRLGKRVVVHETDLLKFAESANMERIRK